MAKRAQPIDRDATTAAERLVSPEEKDPPTGETSPRAEEKPRREFDENALKASERWEIGACIGQGGMAKVYKAFDNRLRRTVALKVLVHEEPDLLRRFQREARAQARIQHEHVLEVYDVGEIDSQPYIAMRYVEGSTLRELFDDLTVEEKVRIFLQVAEALHAAHQAGLLHRDVKPSNILVERRDGGGLKAWVADFGIVSEIDDPSISSSLTGTGGFVGTPVYIPPERLMTPKEQRQSRDAFSDPRGDVYSLGITMYQTLTGVAPFTDEDLFELLDKIVKDNPLPPAILNPEIPPLLEKVVLKCLAKYPEERYSSARELAWKLRACLPEKARRSSPSGRWKVPAAAVALLLVGFTAGTGWRLLAPDDSRWERLRQAEDQAWMDDPRAAEPELRALARVHFHSASLLREQGDLPAAEREARASLAALTRLGGGPEDRRQEASSLCLLGTVLRDRGELEAARAEYRRALDVLTKSAEGADAGLAVTAIEKALAGVAGGTDPCAPLAGL